jgi:hypothetical protein
VEAGALLAERRAIDPQIPIGKEDADLEIAFDEPLPRRDAGDAREEE